jgi:hypothetical protein
MLRRNWTDGEIKDLMGQNLLHVMDEVDAVSDRLRGELPSAAMLSKIILQNGEGPKTLIILTRYRQSKRRCSDMMNCRRLFSLAFVIQTKVLSSQAATYHQLSST